ncbi:uncharacterized protein LOC127859708 [Dreissena polymorpha]|uniref:uncharacterized protein LOC127859708 n=1 Tax=Dreissena polymorpha TaxID=45954 RepID=UPI002263D31C|nr:uncharacterized protein LOC127859708 [Dreissena polymorpha]
MDNYAIFGLVLGCMSAILDLLGLAIPYWNYVDAGFISVNKGLWVACIGIVGCGPIPDVPGELVAVRALMVFSLLLMIAAVVCFLLQKFMMKDKVILTKVAAFVAVSAGILMEFGTVLYAFSPKVKFYTTAP